ncbi:MAG: PASTA domain-containing protein [Thermodesulfovibrionales bacterium]
MKKIFTVPLYLFGFILMGLLSGYLTFKIMSFSKTVDAPDLKGKTVIEATDLLTRVNLYLNVEGEDYDPTITVGRIIRQDIPPGNKVKEQREIRVFLSKGPKVQSVPDLTGQQLHDAESIIAKSGLRIEKIIRVHSRTIEKDVIISQRPNQDEAVMDSLSLVVSLGPYDATYVCPDFSGKSTDEASDLARQLGLRIELVGQGDRVKTQKPKPSSLIKSGDTIELHLEGEATSHG